jgi:hypothetical protein
MMRIQMARLLFARGIGRRRSAPMLMIQKSWVFQNPKPIVLGSDKNRAGVKLDRARWGPIIRKSGGNRSYKRTVLTV